MNNLSRYFGLVAVVFEWAALFIIILLRGPDFSEPFSQYGVGSTRVFFGASLTIVAILILLFMRHLDAYWKHSSACALVAGIMLAATGWVPYRPNVNVFIPDAHNLFVLVGLILYLVPVFFIAYNKNHQKIAHYSKAAFVVLIACCVLSIAVRALGGNVLYIQAVSIIVFQVWLVITNILLLQHHSEALATKTTKL